MRLPRITTRRLMALVAVAALALSAVPAGRRWHHCRRLAAYHARQEQEFRQLQAAALRRRQDDGIGLAEAFEQRAEQHARLRQRFERSAWRPWEPVPVDSDAN